MTLQHRPPPGIDPPGSSDGPDPMGAVVRRLTTLLSERIREDERRREIDTVANVVEPLLERCTTLARRELAREIARIGISTLDMHRDLHGTGPPV